MGVGGALIWTGLTRNLKKQYPDQRIYLIYRRTCKNLVLFRRHPEAFVYENNDDIEDVVPNNSLKFLMLKVKNIFNKKMILVDMSDPDAHYWNKVDKFKIYHKTGKHAIQFACDSFGIKDASIKPKLALRHSEKQKVDTLIEQNFQNRDFIVIDPNCKRTFTPNKDWFWDRWQKLVDKLNKHFSENNLKISILQTGIKGVKVLNGVVDFTGLLTFREVARILERSLFVISHAGGLSHLASAVDTKAIVLTSAWEPKELFAYEGQIILHSDIECKNCGMIIPCEKNRLCMRKISVNQVFNSALLLLEEDKNKAF